MLRLLSQFGRDLCGGLVQPHGGHCGLRRFGRFGCACGLFGRGLRFLLQGLFGLRPDCANRCPAHFLSQSRVCTDDSAACDGNVPALESGVVRHLCGAVAERGALEGDRVFQPDVAFFQADGRAFRRPFRLPHCVWFV